MEYLGEHKVPRRLTGDGKHTVLPTVNGTMMEIRCQKCEWLTIGFVAHEDQLEHLAWMHISNPTLIVPQSSDIWTEARMARMRAEGELN